MTEDAQRADHYQHAADPRSTPFAGSNKARQEVGKPGHCEVCAEVGHVAAHPDLGCGDVGCHSAHDAAGLSGSEEKRHSKLQERGSQLSGYRVDLARSADIFGETGILVRAQGVDGKWINADISTLDTASLNAWLRSRGGENEWAEAVVRILLGHR